jgi:hypothetical protein
MALELTPILHHNRHSPPSNSGVSYCFPVTYIHLMKQPVLSDLLQSHWITEHTRANSDSELI